MLSVVLLPPVRPLPLGHVLKRVHEADPLFAAKVNAGQSLQEVSAFEPVAATYLPAEHALHVLPPLHQCPGGQTSHVVRVFTSPPLVNEPAGQVLHSPWPDELYILSSPQLLQPLRSGPEFLK